MEDIDESFGQPDMTPGQRKRLGNEFRSYMKRKIPVRKWRRTLRRFKKLKLTRYHKLRRRFLIEDGISRRQI
jgi:hypothetical protein